MRPIDADALKELVIETLERIAKMPAMNHEEMHVIAACRMLCEMIDDAPAIDYAPVKHGEFEFQEFEYIPGLCVVPVHCKTCDTTYFTINKDGKRTVCCPYCGARMDGKEDGKDA